MLTYLFLRSFSLSFRRRYARIRIGSFPAVTVVIVVWSFVNVTINKILQRLLFLVLLIHRIQLSREIIHFIRNFNFSSIKLLFHIAFSFLSFLFKSFILNYFLAVNSLSVVFVSPSRFAAFLSDMTCDDEGGAVAMSRFSFTFSAILSSAPTFDARLDVKT